MLYKLFLPAYIFAISLLFRSSSSKAKFYSQVFLLNLLISFMAFPVKELRLVLQLLSGIIGVIFLSKSSFSRMQFEEDGDLKTIVLSVFSALMVTFIFVVPSLKGRVPEAPGNLIKSVVISVSFVIVLVLTFLIKYPRFNVHSEYGRSCVDELREKIAPGSRYNLLSAMAFSLFSLFMSFNREQPGVLGFSNILLGLTIDASTEINETHGPNFEYIGTSAQYCIVLIFLGCYAESLRKNPDGQEARRQEGRLQEARNKILRITRVMELPTAAVAVIFLSMGSFSKLQFENSGSLEVACVGVFSLLLGDFRTSLPAWIDKMVKACNDHSFVKAVVNSVLLLISSALIFLNKYPRFNIHSKYRESCTKKEGEIIAFGSRFDMFSVGAFAFLASLVSSEHDRRLTWESGIFSFLLQLTMDASIETLENKGPSRRYAMSAFIYCVGLIFLNIYFPRDTKNEGDGGRNGGDGHDDGGEHRAEDIERRLIGAGDVGNGGSIDAAVFGVGDEEGDGHRSDGADDTNVAVTSGVVSGRSHSRAENDWEIVEGQGHGIEEIDSDSKRESLDAKAEVFMEDTLRRTDHKCRSGSGLRNRIRSLFGRHKTRNKSPPPKALLNKACFPIEVKYSLL